MHDAAAFVRQARSARIVVQPKGADAKPRQVEVQCPDRVRVVTETTEGTRETVVVDGRGYSRLGQGAWTIVPPAFANAPPVCEGAAWRTGADLPSVLEAMASSPVTEGETHTPLGVPCHSWMMGRKKPPSSPRQVTQIGICLGVEDARPVVMDVGPEVWVFTEWNGDVTIETPEVGATASAEPESSPGNASPPER